MNTLELDFSDMALPSEAPASPELEIDFAQDAQTVTATDEQMLSLSKTVDEYIALVTRIAKAEEWVKAAKKEQQRFETVRIPEIMATCRIANFTTTSNRTVEVKKVVAASIKKENREAAFKWLKENEHGWLIKPTITIELPKQSEELSGKIIASLKALNVPAAVEESVHSATLGKWVRESLEAGETLPLDLLGAFVGDRATIK